jgi:hypothetical protein
MAQMISAAVYQIDSTPTKIAGQVFKFTVSNILTISTITPVVINGVSCPTIIKILAASGLKYNGTEYYTSATAAALEILANA